MKVRFADAQYYVALLNPADQHHDRAKALTSAFDGAIVTTEWVLAEVGNAMSEPRRRGSLVELVSFLRSKRDVTATSIQFQQGLQLYSDRADKAWSLVDCISFVEMNQRGLTEALTADHHFEQAGFVALLK
ncbi:MAG: PIN domain-containing protein [Phycisphaerales bacterium]|nr:MAG: PIN domain-containing protein [Phycisphaerales bacterium]